jgi:hypothetical protein
MVIGATGAVALLGGFLPVDDIGIEPAFRTR